MRDPVTPTVSLSAADPDRRFAAVNRAALALFAAAPLAGLLVGVALLGAGLSSESAVAGGCVFVAILWGFLGSLSWVTAVGAETTVKAIASVKKERRASSAGERPGHGQLSLSAGGSGELAELPSAPGSPRTEDVN